MIFLAITAGFFVENIREHLDDNKKEKEFIHSLKEDLVTDTVNMNSTIQKNDIKYQKLVAYIFYCNWYGKINL